MVPAARCLGARRRQRTALTPPAIGPRGMAHFGDELRRLRAAQGMSLREAARRVPCDSGHLSKLASGRKRPSRAMAERLDEVLGAENALVSLVPAPPASVHPQAETANPAPWGDEFGRDVSAATKRQFTAAFLASLGIA